MATTYVVMLEDDETSALHILGTGSGDTPREAVKAFSEPEGESPVKGLFIAVPQRNWSEELAEPKVAVAYTSRGYDQRLVGSSTGESNDDDPLDEPEAEQLAAAIEGDESVKDDA